MNRTPKVKYPLRQIWYKAQGVPLQDLWRWHDLKKHGCYRHFCVVCGKKWRPDKTPYVAVRGQLVVKEHNDICGVLDVKDPRASELHDDLKPWYAVTLDSVMGTSIVHRIFKTPEVVWYSVGLGINRPIQGARCDLRYMCDEHADILWAVRDSLSGEEVRMVQPLSRMGRFWRDVLYWVGVVWRFPGVLLMPHRDLTNEH